MPTEHEERMAEYDRQNEERRLEQERKSQEINDEYNRVRWAGIAQGIILFFIYIPMGLVAIAACLFGLWCIWELEPTVLLVPLAAIVLFIFICTRTPKQK